MKNKKFIVTQDKETALKLLACGFKQISEVAGIWTFQNIAPKNFSFEAIDKKSYCFTNILSI